MASHASTVLRTVYERLLLCLYPRLGGGRTLPQAGHEPANRATSVVREARRSLQHQGRRVCRSCTDSAHACGGGYRYLLAVASQGVTRVLQAVGRNNERRRQRPEPRCPSSTTLRLCRFDSTEWFNAIFCDTRGSDCEKGSTDRQRLVRGRRVIDAEDRIGTSVRRC